MPAEVVIQAAAKVAGEIGSGILQSRASNRATRAQQQANAEAIALERERDAEEKRRFDEQQAAIKAAWDEQQARRDAVRARYGLSGSRRTMPPGWTPGAQGASPGGRVPATLSASAMDSGLDDELLTPPLMPPRSPWGEWGA